MLTEIKKRTTFFTCCNKKYECFIPLFIHSILFYNDVDIEICVEDFEKLENNVIKCLEYLKENYKNSKILIRNANFNYFIIENKKYKIIPNIVRFLETPQIKNSFVYLCDIDIITLQKDIQKIHTDYILNNKIDYSNIVRPNSNRLSGLHFTKWDSLYPLPDFEDLVKKGMLNHDEVFLYNLVKKKNKINEKLTFRPVHGIHISQNREKILEWGVKKWKEDWYFYRNSNSFKYLEHFFSELIKEKILKIDNYYKFNEN